MAVFWGPFFGPKLKRRARAPTHAAAKRHFSKINQHGMGGFVFRARALKTDRLKGIRFLKNGKYSFWAISGSLFSPKKFYYSLGFSVVLDDLPFPFWQIVFGQLLTVKRSPLSG